MMNIIYKDPILSRDYQNSQYTISVSEKDIKVEFSAISLGEGYTFIISKECIPDINKDNAMTRIKELLHHKETKICRDVIVKYWTKNVPFSLYCDTNSGKKNIMY